LLPNNKFQSYYQSKLSIARLITVHFIHRLTGGSKPLKRTP